MDGDPLQSQPSHYGVDAIRQAMLGSNLAAAGLGATVFGHKMTIGQQVLNVGALGSMLIAIAV